MTPERQTVLINRGLRIALLLVALGAVVWVFHHLATVIIMLAVAGILAFILDPLVMALARRMPRGLAIAVTYLTLMACLVLALIGVVPRIVGQVAGFQRNLPHYQAAFEEVVRQSSEEPAPALSPSSSPSPSASPVVVPPDESAVPMPDALHTVEDIKNNETVIKIAALVRLWRSRYEHLPPSVKAELERVRESAAQTAGHAADTLVATLVGVLGWAAKGMIILVLSIYLLVDKVLIRDFLLNLIPHQYREETFKIGGEVLNVIRAYLRGQLVVIGFVAFAVTLVLVVCRIPYALTIGTLAGTLEIIPYFGAATGAIPAVILGLVRGGPLLAGGLILFFILINQLEGHVVIPTVMGRTMEMRPLMVLLSLLVGAEVAGIIGLMVAVPVARIGQVLVEHGIRLYRQGRPPVDRHLEMLEEFAPGENVRLRTVVETRRADGEVETTRTIETRRGVDGNVETHVDAPLHTEVVPTETPEPEPVAAPEPETTPEPAPIVAVEAAPDVAPEEESEAPTG
ncbi:MAG: AI-2E family transporter [Candidatus Xenobia bacterium]